MEPGSRRELDELTKYELKILKKTHKIHNKL